MDYFSHELWDTVYIPPAFFGRDSDRPRALSGFLSPSPTGRLTATPTARFPFCPHSQQKMKCAAGRTMDNAMDKNSLTKNREERRGKRAPRPPRRSLIGFLFGDSWSNLIVF